MVNCRDCGKRVNVKIEEVKTVYTCDTILVLEITVSYSCLSCQARYIEQIYKAVEI